MIETWLSLPVWALLSSLALFLMGTAGVLYWCSFHGPSRTWVAGFRDVEGPVFGAAALLFAMLTGFVASDVWQRNASAARLKHQLIGRTALRQAMISRIVLGPPGGR